MEEIVDADIEDGVARTVRADAELPYELRHGKRSVPRAVAKQLGDLPQVFVHRPVPRRFHADDTGVDKHTGHIFLIFPAHVHREADHQILAAAVHAQRNRKRGQEKRKRGDAVALGRAADFGKFFFVKREREHLIGARMILRPLPLERHLRHRDPVREE